MSPSTRACRRSRVVSPNERLSRAYSSLPTRMSVSSRRRTTAASTFSRVETWAGEIRVAAFADPGQDLREVDESLELGVVATRSPALVVAILLAPPRVAPGGLQVPGGVGTDPDVGPRRRDGQLPDPPQDRPVVDRRPIGRPVAEPAPGPAPFDPGSRIGRVAESRGASRGPAIRIGRGRRRASGHPRTMPPDRSRPAPRDLAGACRPRWRPRYDRESAVAAPRSPAVWNGRGAEVMTPRG